MPGRVAGRCRGRAALEVGRSSADLACQRFVRGTGRGEWMASATMARMSRQIDDALARAVAAFESGRYANGAATLRVSDTDPSAGDYHFFVNPEGETRIEPALGDEGVHHRPASR